MPASIPVFVSGPSDLAQGQQRAYDHIVQTLRAENLEPRALGRSDYGVVAPLREVYYIATHCSGGVVLGFEQMFAQNLDVKRGTPSQEPKKGARMPTPWNNLEAGVLFALKRPLLVFRESGISGGIFDLGASDIFLQHLPSDTPTLDEAESIKATVQLWVAEVRRHYRTY